MIKIAICDDMEVVSKSMKKILSSYDFSVEIYVDNFVSGIELFNNAITKKYDIILLDIELTEDNKENGMLVSTKIKNAYPNVIIIFFTGKTGYERELLNFEPFRYLNKPIKENELIEAVRAAIRRMNGWENQFFYFKFNGIKMKVDINRIILFESQSPHIIIKCIDEEIRFRGKIDTVEKEIIEISTDFIRVSKSCLVNKCFIKTQSSKEILLTNGEAITISRKYAKNFLAIK